MRITAAAFLILWGVAGTIASADEQRDLSSLAPDPESLPTSCALRWKIEPHLFDEPDEMATAEQIFHQWFGPEDGVPFKEVRALHSNFYSAPGIDQGIAVVSIECSDSGIAKDLYRRLASARSEGRFADRNGAIVTLAVAHPGIPAYCFRITTNRVSDLLHGYEADDEMPGSAMASHVLDAAWRNFWENARLPDGEPTLAAHGDERANLPIPAHAAQRIILVGFVSGMSERCGLD